jgi:type VI secretion system protein ImpB
MSDSGQKALRRNRPPRVHITYEDPGNAEKMVELPFVMGVMADLSGNSPGVQKQEIADRKFLDVHAGNLESRMKAIQPGVSFRVPSRLREEKGENLQVNLRFNRMADFKPAQVASQVPELATLLKARDQLKNLQLYMGGRADAEKTLRELLNDPTLMLALQDRAAGKKPDGNEEQ